jgi:hypothetical protein|tara:strand:- start:549 stop:983 length:435 start_codon:yes stop_codon:yes gene_type:complete
MSKREDIAANIVTVLTAISSPITLIKITRQPFDLNQLSQQQFPCAWVQTADETREDSDLGSDIREASIDFVIQGFTQSSETNIDTKRNELITTIETALDSDRTRGGYAKDTEVVSVETDEGIMFPIGGVRIVVRCFYIFTSGTP